MLSDHIEKLMVFLKHEATQKAKAHDQQRRLQKELELVKVSTILLASSLIDFLKIPWRAVALTPQTLNQKAPRAPHVCVYRGTHRDCP